MLNDSALLSPLIQIFHLPLCSRGKTCITHTSRIDVGIVPLTRKPIYSGLKSTSQTQPIPLYPRNRRPVEISLSSSTLVGLSFQSVSSPLQTRKKTKIKILR